MNQDIAEGKWRQMKGHIKSWWGRLTEDEIEQISGKWDLIVGKLQEKYGYDKAQAEKECRARFDAELAAIKKS